MLLQSVESANMEQSVPENLSTHAFGNCEMKLEPRVPEPSPICTDSETNVGDPRSPKSATKLNSTAGYAPSAAAGTAVATSPGTKMKLSFSVDRLLSVEKDQGDQARQCCDNNIYACCSFPNCFGGKTDADTQHTQGPIPVSPQSYAYGGLDKMYPNFYADYKSVLRPTPIRALGHSQDHVPPFPTLATNALVRFHQQHHQFQQQHHHQQHKSATLLHSASATSLLAPLNSLKSLQLSQQQHFLAKTQQLLDIPTTTHATTTTGAPTGAAATNAGAQNGGHNNNNSSHGSNMGGHVHNNGKRKRSWSRAVFTNLQRKGLEIQFQQQKYITKPDRRKLAARLNLTDAQVKVWFQNRRMKWRHTRENLKSGQEKPPSIPPPGTGNCPVSSKTIEGTSTTREVLSYSSDSCSSVELSEQADDDDNIEIDVVE
ncbi:homeobox protein H2.0 [Scaptodrosophila lebanonensis]|uniref:Homeobox protein H2.0 n=1 Tax=Drosophila lebanonensis TaxID=7225 RepID=A0A6J2TP38_DROLE|nr:homeobox protein H2.0 [Scaptodrosophila lebanonensis]